jgi:hypothetical protein
LFLRVFPSPTSPFIFQTSAAVLCFPLIDYADQAIFLPHLPMLSIFDV